MTDAMQSLPLGNGDIGANVWLSPDGDLHILLAKSDSWSELYRLLKPAHVVLRTEPALFASGAEFELNIADAVLTVSGGGASLRMYADAFAPCIRLSLTSETPADIRLELLNYRREAIDPGDDFSNYFMRGGIYDIVESADEVMRTPGGGAAQIHRNTASCYEFALRNQDMESYIGRERDPLLGRTFGAGLYSPELCADGEGLTGAALTEMTASIFVATKFTESADELRDSLDDLHAKYGDDRNEVYTAHVQSWREFWEKAYIYAEGDEQAEQVTRAFLYQRYMTRCADRGNAPMKFNGLLFTADQMEGRPGNYDARRWGAPFWIQNTRIMYWYLLYMGDYESMLPMFDMYLNMMPIAMARCESYFGHAGMLIPETAAHFGLYANSNYGFADEHGVRQGEGGRALRRGEPCNWYIRYHYNGMLELSWMMLRYLEVSGDKSRRTQMLAFIEQTLLFFDRHFDHVDGKLMMNPVSSLETWQLCVNDAPDVAGLKAVCEALAKLPELPESLKKLVNVLLPAIPELPTETADDGTILAPCELKIDTVTRNVENPELYAVFPFERYGLGKDGLDIARRTYDHRRFRHNGGWSQDPVDAALLGLTDEAVRHLVRQTGMKDVRALFPAFWGPNFDETPDQDHGGMTCLCLIFMLLQASGGSYTAFPAWPENWNVRFRLPVNRDVCICGEQIDGQRRITEE